MHSSKPHLFQKFIAKEDIIIKTLCLLLLIYLWNYKTATQCKAWFKTCLGSPKIALAYMVFFKTFITYSYSTLPKVTVALIRVLLAWYTYACMYSISWWSVMIRVCRYILRTYWCMGYIETGLCRSLSSYAEKSMCVATQHWI